MKIQLIFSRNFKGYNRTLEDEDDHGRCCNDPARENKGIEDGRPLTLILFFALLLCCGTWTWTVWYASQPSGDVKNFAQPIIKLKDQTVSDNNFHESISNIISNTDQCTLLPKDLRFDCYPEEDVNEEKCEQRGCCWNGSELGALRSAPLNVPYCYYPQGYYLYQRILSEDLGQKIIHSFRNIKPSGFPGDISNLQIEVTCYEKSTLRIRIVDQNHSRFEVPFMSLQDQQKSLTDCDLYFELPEENSLNFRIRRRNENEVLFDTLEAGTFIFSDQYLQLSSTLMSKYIYGLEEHRKPFLKDIEWTSMTFWNADQWPSASSTNLYGSHPFYMNVNPETGTGFGFFWLNSNAMEAVLQPTPAITLRSIGGIFDLFFMAGPNPKHIVSQYNRLIGKPFLPPYWSLGYHQCKFGYGSLNRTKEILSQTLKANIPIDVQWNDIDYMDDRKDFTYDHKKFHGLPQFVDQLHQQGLHYIPIIDPGISSTEKEEYVPYERGLEMDIFIKNTSGYPFNGRVWTNGETVWPDFTDPKAQDYWEIMLKSYYDQVKIDGAWIDMNEPSDFYNGQKHGCDGSKWNQPPYLPRSLAGNSLFHKTVCPSARQYLGRHYDLHNVYGFSEGIATNKALTKIREKRPFIISRSTFPGYGNYGGHWTGDVLSDWSSMKDSITGVLNFNLLGIPMVGADICGFNGNTTFNLCQRWVQLGAFYPFARNHNTDDGIDQDPVSLGPGVVEAAKEALSIRYELLPFLYSLFVKAHLYGHPVITPTFFHAHSGDKIAYGIDTQMFWGSELLIAPALEENLTHAVAYLPSGTWYDYRTMNKINAQIPGFVNLAAPLTLIPLLARGGSIFPSQIKGANNTRDSQKLPFHMKIFLDDKQTAHGELYWDDGDSLNTYDQEKYTHLKFGCANTTCFSLLIQNGSTLPLPNLNQISISGLNQPPQTFHINDRSYDFKYETKRRVLSLANLKISMMEKLLMTWM